MADRLTDGYRHLLVDLRANGVCEVTLNRSEALNAWNDALIADLLRLWMGLQGDPRVKVVLLTGAGRAFSVGGDIDHLERLMATTDEAARACIAEYTALLRGIIDLDRPVIAAINGDVVGGGAGLALVCDVTFMAEDARLLGGGQLNIHAVPAEAPFLWPLLCGLAKAKYHLFAAEFIVAHDAERIGLVSAVVPTDELLSRARSFADRLAGKDATVLGWTKRAANHWLRIGAPILDFSLALEALAFRRPEAREGLAAMANTIRSQEKP